MDSSIRIIRYSQDFKEVWNDFVESSKNGTFLFNRAYMDYHADRFNDHSFLIYRKNKLYCLLPANIRVSEAPNGGKILFSHQGLTYGGLIMSEKCTAEGILEVFQSLKKEFEKVDIKKVIYKPVPHIYHVLPSEEDLYSLFRNNAKLIVRNISATIDLHHLLRFNKDRREAVRRGMRNNIKISLSNDLESFWKILENNLMLSYHAKPVHSLDEIKRITSLFPENIKLWAAFSPSEYGDEMIAGVVIYYMKNTVHAQYISATPEGKKKGAVDLIVNTLIQNLTEEDKGKEWFDLGTSNEDGGRILNESLIYQKEGFGARAVCYDTYEWTL